MKLLVYAVYDSKAAAYLKPFFMKTRGEAIRAWVDVVNDPQTQFNKHPEDYTLFALGEYSEDHGQFTNYETPRSEGVALEFVKKG